jgi:hypothetical protein
MYIIFLILMLLLALVLLFIVFSAFFGFLITRVPFVPTSKNDIEFIVKELEITSADIFYDLGSGDGKVCFLVNNLSGAKCVGFELTWWTYIISKLKVKSAKLKNVFFINKNFFKQPWTEAAIVYGYLYPPLMGKVEEKFLKDCKPGSLAIIRDFPFPNLKPKQIYQLPRKHEIYVYQIVDKQKL